MTRMVTGVVVLGMHRGGTSAVTGALRFAGLHLPDEKVLLRPGPSNPTGYFEVRPLVRLNQRLLWKLHGDWSAPPRLEAGWEDDAALVGMRESAEKAFRSSMPTAPWLWKDPRNCITLPFWLRAVDVRPAAVVVVRSPGEIARSLSARDGFSRLYSVALWERHMRDLLANVAGLGTVVTTFDRLVADPVATTHTIRDGLASLGVEVGEIDEAAVAEFVSRMGGPGGEGAPLSAEQRALVETLEGLVGTHASMPDPGLGPMTDWAQALLEERRRLLDDQRTFYDSLPLWWRKMHGARRHVRSWLARRRQRPSTGR